MVTADGAENVLNASVTKVDKPLLSVGQIVRNGGKVVFNDVSRGGSYIDTATGKTNIAMEKPGWAVCPPDVDPPESALFSQAGLKQPVRPLNDDREDIDWWTEANQLSGGKDGRGEPSEASPAASGKDDRLGLVDELDPVPQEGCEEFEQAPDGLSHHGDPDDEVIVVEEPDRGGAPGPVVVRPPRARTQKELDAHVATHLPHEPWCEYCMKGRGRNSPHKQRRRRRRKRYQPRAGSPAGPDSEPDADGDPQVPSAEGERVPRIIMDYFYLSSREAVTQVGAAGMSTKELQKRLRELGRSDKGPWYVLAKRYEKYAPEE